jgi:hypothetical protein
MFASRRIVLSKTLVFVVWLLAFRVSLFGEATKRQTSSDSVVRTGNFQDLRTIGRFLTDLFPELRGTELRMAVQDIPSLQLEAPRSGVTYSVYLTRRTGADCCQAGVPISPPYENAEKTTPQRAIKDETIFVAGVVSEPDGRLQLFSPHNLFPPKAEISKKLESLVEEVRKHEEWQQKERLEALERAGAKFTPERRAELVQILPLTVLRRYLGLVTVKSLQFVTAEDHAPEPGADRGVTMQWELVLEPIPRPRTDMSHPFRTVYEVHFEPFEGTLTAIGTKSR